MLQQIYSAPPEYTTYELVSLEFRQYVLEMSATHSQLSRRPRALSNFQKLS